MEAIKCSNGDQRGLRENVKVAHQLEGGEGIVVAGTYRKSGPGRSKTAGEVWLACLRKVKEPVM